MIGLALLAVALAQPASLLDDPATVLPRRPEANTPTVAVLGFSPSGAFAWLQARSHPEMDGLAWRLTIQDLVTDETRATLQGELPDGSTLADVLRVEREPLRQALVAHAITGPPRLHPTPANLEDLGLQAQAKASPHFPPGSPLLRPFPLYVEDRACTVDVVPRSREDFTLALRCGHRSKPLAAVASSHAGPVPLGAVVSPYEQRVAILVLTTGPSLHGGDPMTLDAQFVGAHLVKGFGD